MNTFSDIFNGIFFGAGLINFLYVLSFYVRSHRVELLWYGIYVFVMLVYVFYRIDYAQFIRDGVEPLLGIEADVLSDFLQLGGHIAYFIFLRQFLSTRQNIPFLDRLFSFSIGLIAVHLVFLWSVDVFNIGISIQSIRFATRMILLTAGVLMMQVCWKNWTKISSCIFYGNGFVIFFGLIATIKQIEGVDKMLIDSLIWVQIGFLFEFFFFILAIGYKNQMIIEEIIQKQAFQTEQALQREQQTRLYLLSTLNGTKDQKSTIDPQNLSQELQKLSQISQELKQQNPENATQLQKITEKSERIAQNIDQIAWLLNPKNDSLQSLIEYTNQYIRKITEPFAGLKINFNYPKLSTKIYLDEQKRGHIFFIIKECLNNSTKHAQATNISIDLQIINKIVVYTIKDNGIGFDLNAQQATISGLKMIEQRTQQLNGVCHIDSIRDLGTSVYFNFPI